MNNPNYLERLPTLLKDQLGNDGQEIHLLGSTSWFSLIPFFSFNQDLKRPQVLVLSSELEMELFTKALHFFNPNAEVHCLTGFDVSPYSQLYPHPKVMCKRMNWLYKAQNASPGEIFLTTIEGLSQLTIPVINFLEHTQSFQLGSHLPDNFQELFHRYGYNPVSYTEDPGSYCIRGGIIDIYSPAHKQPIRIELFGNEIDSIRYFDPVSQKSTKTLQQFVIIPTKESLLTEENRQSIAQKIKANHQNSLQNKLEPDQLSSLLYSIGRGTYFQGIDFYLPYFYKSCDQVLDHFCQDIDLWLLNPMELTQQLDTHIRELTQEWNSNPQIVPPPSELFVGFDQLQLPPESRKIHVSKIDFYEENSHREINHLTQDLNDFINPCRTAIGDYKKIGQILREKISHWSDYKIFISSESKTLSQRLEQLLTDNKINYELVSHNDYLWQTWCEDQEREQQRLHIIPRHLTASLRFTDEKMIFIQDKDIFGHQRRRATQPDAKRMQEKAKALSFGDLSPKDLIVHKFHGVGIFKGLTLMPIAGCQAEFIQIEFKDKDKLYLPIYRISQIQKYSGPSSTRLIDKLGGSQWGKVTTKIKKHLRDMTRELLQNYARRKNFKRPPLNKPSRDYFKFEDSFIFEETDDQAKAIEDILSDLMKDSPMDRLICGDVGFGKTEVAMRAAFATAYNGRQVALIAPTTILTMQHFENFQKRFKGWPFEIRLLNRFINKNQVKETINDLSHKRVDIVIGTHRLLSKDIKFNDLGLLIIDEEQKFGVKHKEKVKSMKPHVDTITLSATPIPRTLNMSLLGLRDLSLISTPPVDRLPIRTFISHYDKSTIKRAIENEISRNGQVFFLHNRIQTIEVIASELRELLPHVRFAIAHGQMEENQLERVMMDFLSHKIDVLICTTIIESGIDVPRANTMFINEAQQFGLSQLYQLRGRIGRSKERAYCYLLLPRNKILDSDSQERLRILKDNTELGSGIRVAQHDLELRGAGDFLGESQSGHINSIGHELYMELLEDAIQEGKGEKPQNNSIEPDMNIRIPAYIPDKYISDIRVRLAYYKVLSNIKSPQELDEIESDLQDQFGKIPEEVLNLMGLMLIRKDCKDLGIKDIVSSKNAITLTFTDQTPLPPDKVIQLSLQENKKYSITPNNRLKIRMKKIEWPQIYQETSYLKKLCVGYM